MDRESLRVCDYGWDLNSTKCIVVTDQIKNMTLRVQL